MKQDKRRLIKEWLLCREIGLGKRIWLDAGAIHGSLKSAENHLRLCDDPSSLRILPVYILKEGKR